MTPNHWSAAVRQVGRWADGFDGDRFVTATRKWSGPAYRDRHDGPPAPTERRADRSGPGGPASLWALTKATVAAAGSPFAVPAVVLAAMWSAQAARARIEGFPDHLHAVAEGRPSELHPDRTVRLPAEHRYLITSDLHRCTAGRLDWPRRQRVKELYARVIEGYALDGWHLVENGDVEDFWMTGGSTWGMVYDLASMVEFAAGPVSGTPSAAITEHLDRIVANNADIYRVIDEAYCADGRYHRTMGNHDDVLADPHVVERLGTHLTGVDVADTILLERPGATPAEGIAGIDAVIAHGHLTDSWNGPGFAHLGRALTRLSTTLGDLPLRAGARDREGLPDPETVGRLLEGGRNRLITIDARFGGNRRFDSLDEERLFARLGETEPDRGWPWLVHGHTHYPMLRPHDASGRPVRYANSGCGVLEASFTALEWDASDPEEPLRLVLWTNRYSPRPERIELVPDGRRLRPAGRARR